MQFAGILEKIFVHSDKPLVFRVLIYAAYLGPPIVVALLIWHEMTGTDLVWSSTEITRPHDAYLSSRGEGQQADLVGSGLVGSADPPRHWRPSDAYRDAFMEEFSKSYFGRTSRYQDVLAPGVDQASLTVILKNDASSRSILVNSVSVVASLQDERPFDWRDLDVSAGLTIRSGDWGSHLVFVNDGVGPIVDLTTELTADDGLPLSPLSPIEALQTDQMVFLERQQPGYHGPYVVHEGYLQIPLYRVIEDGETVQDETALVDCSGDDAAIQDCYSVGPNRYEEIRTLERLGELTDLQMVSAVDISYRFKDLKGEPTSGEQTVTLDPPIYWYRAADHLLDALPLIGPVEESMDYQDGMGNLAPEEIFDDFGADEVIALAKQFFGVAVEGPKGVGLIKAELSLDVSDMPECDFNQAITEPRTLLQGGGFVSISVDLGQPRNGRYLLRFLVNGEDRHALTIDLVAPGERSFDGDVQTDRFVSYDEDPPPACNAPLEAKPEGEALSR